MLIKLGTLTLCAGGPEGPLDGVRRERTREIQVAHRIRADGADVFGRGNAVYRISFSALRTFDSVADASAFCESHEADLPTNATLSIKADGASSAIEYEGAAISSVSFSQTGRSVIVTYDFVCPCR